jgi:hypothetical protein
MALLEDTTKPTRVDKGIVLKPAVLYMK